MIAYICIYTYAYILKCMYVCVLDTTFCMALAKTKTKGR